MSLTVDMRAFVHPVLCRGTKEKVEISFVRDWMIEVTTASLN